MKVIIISNSGSSLIGFRGELIKEIIRNGHQVIAIAPEIDQKEKVNNLGAIYYSVPFQRNSINPLTDIKTIIKFYKIMKQVKPDIFLGYTIKPVVYGSIAAKFSKINKKYSMITGLGSLFIDDNRSFPSMVAKQLYKIGLHFNHRVIFQNIDDLNEFVKQKIVAKKKAVVVNGSGVNLSYYQNTALPKKMSFLMVSRLIRDKGIIEFLEACKSIKEIYPEVECMLVGGFDTNPTALKAETLKPYFEDGIVKYHGKTDDVRPFLSRCSVFVLPSYREGTPRSVLEAMAMGRPVITTDVPGCRQTVNDGINGFLVPAKDVKSIYKRMEWFIHNQDKIFSMGQASYAYCLKKYDVKKVNRQMLKIMEL